MATELSTLTNKKLSPTWSVKRAPPCQDSLRSFSETSKIVSAPLTELEDSVPDKWGIDRKEIAVPVKLETVLKATADLRRAIVSRTVVHRATVHKIVKEGVRHKLEDNDIFSSSTFDAI